MDILATELWMTTVWKVKGGMEPLRVSLIWNGVVKLARLQKTFWAFQMGDDPMTLQIPYGHSCHWGMGGHCLEARARVGLREYQSIPGAKWCGQNITLQENVLSIPNGKSPYDIPDTR